MMQRQAPIVETSTTELLHAAADGDQQAWNRLVDRFAGLVWSVARSFRLDAASATDVSQTVWLRLVENCDRIRDPERLAGWLATTTRREALAVQKRQRRLIPTDTLPDLADDGPEPWREVVEGSQAAAVAAALVELPESDQQLLRLVTADPPLTYEEVAEVLGRPVGSIGPSRARALERLRRRLAAIEAVPVPAAAQ